MNFGRVRATYTHVTSIFLDAVWLFIEPNHIPQIVLEKSYLRETAKVASTEDVNEMKEQDFDVVKQKYYSAWRFHAKVTDGLSFFIGS